MRRVFEGGEGEIRGGIAERSSERGVSVGFLPGLDAADDGGEALRSDILMDGKAIKGQKWFFEDDYGVRSLLIYMRCNGWEQNLGTF